MLDCELISALDPQDPSLGFIHPTVPAYKDLDFSTIDYILISSYRTGSAIPYITEYTSFRGRILATKPTIEFLSLMCLEYTRDTETENKKRKEKLLDLAFYDHDVECSISVVEPIFYNHTQKLKPNFQVTATSSGTGLGTCNWVIEYGSFKLIYSPYWTKLALSYARQMDVESIMAADAFISAQIFPPPKNQTINPKPIKVIWPEICESFKSNQSVIIACEDMIEELFATIDIFYNLLDSSGIKHIPIHIVSLVSSNALLLSNVFTEWMSQDRQLETMKANQPLIHGNLLSVGKIICHSDITELEKYPGPRLVITTSDTNKGPLQEFLAQSNKCDQYTFLLSDYFPIDPKRIEIDYPNAKFKYYKSEQNEYSTIKQLEQLVGLVNPRHIIAYDTDNLSGGFDSHDIEIKTLVPFDALNLEFIKDTKLINITGCVYCPQMKAESAHINIDPLIKNE